MNVHRYWTGPAPSTEPFATTVLAKLGTLHDWSDETLPGEVVSWLDAHTSQVTEETAIRHRSNMVRWWALSQLGGVWFDHDALPLVPLGVLGELWTCSMGFSRSACGCAFPVGHGVPIAMLAHIESFSGRRRPCPEVSGDRVLNRVCPQEVPRVQLPFDASGRLVAVGPVQVVHTWSSTHRRAL